MNTPYFGRSVVIAALTLGGLAACTHLSNRRLTTTNWESQYQPAPACAMSLAAGKPTSAAGTGALVVRLSPFESNGSLWGIMLTMTPLASPNAARRWMEPANRRSVIHEFDSLPPGRYVFGAHLIGTHPRADTVTIRAGETDTLVAGVEPWVTGDLNAYNCRPRHFRHAGEAACVTEADSIDWALDRARYKAEFEARRLRLSGQTTIVMRTVRDERVCERAARAYGGPQSPPRRMIVIDAGDFFVVTDPYEQVLAGEWGLWQVYDRRWHLLDDLLG